MLLVIDVGNTNTGLGVFDGRRLTVSWRLASRREQTADEYGVFIQSLLATQGIERGRVKAIALSNVVPPVQQTLQEMCEKYFGIRPFSVEPAVNVKMVLRVENPQEVGPDRVVNAVAAVELYGPPLIVIDFGTATTFDCVNSRGEFIGGAIAPGIAASAEALISKAARLYRVELVRPKEAIGRNTVTNIQSGLVYGYASLVDGLVGRLRAEMDGDPKVIATGGLAPLIQEAARTIQQVNPDLTLEGLRLVWEQAHPGGP